MTKFLWLLDKVVMPYWFKKRKACKYYDACGGRCGYPGINGCSHGHCAIDICPLPDWRY